MNFPSPLILVLLFWALLLSSPTTQAGNATWNLNPGSGDWNTTTNWTPNTVPGEADIATFNTSNVTDITFSQVSGILEILFNPGASSFTYTVSDAGILTFTIVGVVNNSGVTQNFICDGDAQGNSSFIIFHENATTSAQTLFAVKAAMTPGGGGGVMDFKDSPVRARARLLAKGGL
jgi:hypothetical protein